MKSILRRLAFLTVVVLWVSTTGAQNTIVIHGQVTDLANQPIPGHQVNIMVDSVFNVTPPFSYTSNVITDVNGYYNDSVLLPAGGTSAMVFTSVSDCINNIHNLMQFYMAPTPLPAMNFSVCSGTAPGFPIVHTFDSINPFYTDSLCIWQHGVPNGSIINSAFSSPNAWVTNLNGHYPNNTNCYLYSDVYSFMGLTGSDTVTLGFRHWCAFATGDYGRVQYSTNGGQSWINLGSVGDANGTNWYNVFSGGQNYFSYTNTGWMYSSYKLDPNFFNAKPQVQFRFHIFSNASGTSDGWALDDFSLTVSGSMAHAGVTNINHPMNNMPAGSIVNTTITITNYTSNALTLIPVELRLNWSLVAVETYTGFLPGNQSDTYTFIIPFSVPAGPYQLCARTSLPIGGTSNTQYCRNLFGTMNPTGYLYGLLNAGSGPAGPSEVYLIQHDTIAGTLTAHDTTLSVDSAGVTSYHFANLPPGNYLVKAAMLPANPLYASNIPTYYQSSLFWSQAMPVNVLPNAFTQASINFIQGINPGGPGFVGGLISQGANKGPGDPIEGVQVLLLDVNNGDAPVAVSWSDVTGLFGFSNIPYGTYKVYAEVLSKITNPVIVSIDANNPSAVGIKIVIGTNIVSYITETEESIIGEIYPNPASDVCYLPLKLLRHEIIKTEIVDLAGRTVFTKINEFQAGESSIELDILSLRKGMYIVNLINGDGIKSTRKLIIY